MSRANKNVFIVLTTYLLVFGYTSFAENYYCFPKVFRKKRQYQLISAIIFRKGVLCKMSTAVLTNREKETTQTKKCFSPVKVLFVKRRL